MTFLGGFLHRLTFLIANIHQALTLAYSVVGLELLAISWVRNRCFASVFLVSCVQVLVGGAVWYLPPECLSKVRKRTVPGPISLDQS